MESTAVEFVRQASRRSFRIAVAVALVVHLPFTPLPLFARLLGPWLSAHDTAWDYQDDSVIVPISLEELPAHEAPKEVTVAPPSEPTAPKAPAPSPSRSPVDAGAPQADAALAQREGGADAASDARRARDATTDGPQGGAARDAFREAERIAEGPSQGAAPDPLRLVGAVGKVVKGKPNVELLVWFGPLRSHPVGARVGEMLSCNPQWRDFLGNAIDPLRDLEGVFLFGPRMTDTSKLTVAAQVRMDDAKLRRVLEGLVERSGSSGGFLDAGVGVISARIHADRAERVVLSHPRSMVYVTPPEGAAQIMAQREALSLPPAQGRVLALMLVTPSRPLRRIGFSVPDTLKELRLSLSLTPGGGVDAVLELDDGDAALAEEHAAALTEELAQSPLRLFLGEVRFQARDARLLAHATLSPMAAGLVLSMARGLVCPSAGLDAGMAPRSLGPASGGGF